MFDLKTRVFSLAKIVNLDVARGYLFQYREYPYERKSGVIPRSEAYFWYQDRAIANAYATEP